MANNYIEVQNNVPTIEVIEREIQTIGVKYMECQRNHSPHHGVQAVDGCGEFVLRGPADERDEAKMFCEACGCHRNFHRKVFKKKLNLVYYKDEDSNVLQYHVLLAQINNEHN